MCGNSASTDLYGGCPVKGIPTVIRVVAARWSMRQDQAIQDI